MRFAHLFQMHFNYQNANHLHSCINLYLLYTYYEIYCSLSLFVVQMPTHSLQRRRKRNGIPDKHTRHNRKRITPKPTQEQQHTDFHTFYNINHYILPYQIKTHVWHSRVATTLCRRVVPSLLDNHPNMNIYIIPLPLALIPNQDGAGFRSMYWTDYASTYIRECYNNGDQWIASGQDYILITIYLYSNGKTNVNRMIRIEYSPCYRRVLKKCLEKNFEHKYVKIGHQRVPVVKCTGRPQDPIYLYHMNGHYNTTQVE